MSAAIRRSPMARLHAGLGARLESNAGWEIVGGYGDEAAERSALHDAVGMGDVTPRGKVDVRGAVGESVHGGEGWILARVADDWALVLTGPGGEPEVMSAMESNFQGPRTTVTDVTHLYVGLVLVGPVVPDACARLTSWNPATLDPAAATGASFAEVPAVVVNREGALPMLEIFVSAEFGRYVWETVAGVVARLGGRPVGWDALRAEGWA